MVGERFKLSSILIYILFNWDLIGSVITLSHTKNFTNGIHSFSARAQREKDITGKKPASLLVVPLSNALDEIE